MYYYAETTDGSKLEWNGDAHTMVKDRALAMKKTSSGSVVKLTCDQN